jgi:DNA-binding Lrp family transcriptional regulator
MDYAGRPPALAPEDVLQILKDAEEPFLSSGEITERSRVSKPTVLDRLNTLEERGDIRSREVASNTPVWYLPELEERPPVGPSDDEEPSQQATANTETDGGAAVDAVTELRKDLTETNERLLDRLETVEEQVAGVAHGTDENETGSLPSDPDERAVAIGERAKEDMQTWATRTVGFAVLLAVVWAYTPDVATTALPMTDLSIASSIAMVFLSLGGITALLGTAWVTYTVAGEYGVASWINETVGRLGL